jgi:hypothetical protein
MTEIIGTFRAAVSRPFRASVPGPFQRTGARNGPSVSRAAKRAGELYIFAVPFRPPFVSEFAETPVPVCTLACTITW